MELGSKGAPFFVDPKALLSFPAAYDPEAFWVVDSAYPLVELGPGAQTLKSVVRETWDPQPKADMDQSTPALSSFPAAHTDDTSNVGEALAGASAPATVEERPRQRGILQQRDSETEEHVCGV